MSEEPENPNPEDGELNDEEEEEEQEYERDPLEQVWAYGLNDAIKIQEENIAAKSGNFFEDFLNCCEEFRLIPHPAMSKEKFANSIVCKGLLLDLCSVKIMRHLLPTSQTVEHLKFTNCRLDAEMVGLLTDALAEERTTVKTLVLDWNKVELPLSIPDDVTEIPRLEHLEIQRLSDQGKRDAQLWIELVLESTDMPSMRHVVERLKREQWAPSASRRDLRRCDLANDRIDYPQFCYHFGARIGVPMRDDLFQRAFDYFDGPAFGGGQGSFKLDIVEKGSEQIPIITATDFPPAPPAEEAAEGGAEPVEEARDAVGAVWHKLINSSFVESLSARCSGLSRLEAPALGEALRGQNFLRQLNLYGNNLSDRSMAVFAPCFAENSSLEFLGLGNNSITDAGMQSLCDYLGATIIEDKAPADERIAAQSASSLPAASKDGAGNERYLREAVHVDQVIEIPPPGPDENTPTRYYWFRNKTLKHLNLSSNRIKNVEQTKELLSLGNPTAVIVLKGNPVVVELQAEQYVSPSPIPPVEDGELPTTGWQVDYGQIVAPAPASPPPEERV